MLQPICHSLLPQSCCLVCESQICKFAVHAVAYLLWSNGYTSVLSSPAAKLHKHGLYVASFPGVSVEAIAFADTPITYSPISARCVFFEGTVDVRKFLM